MRIVIAGTALAALALLQAGCGKAGPPAPAAAERPAGSSTTRMATTVQVADPKMAAQLVSGFHGVENGSWRWTQRQFTVALGRSRGRRPDRARRWSSG